MDRQPPLGTHYDALESRLPMAQEDELARLVVPNGNAAAPVHRWFHLKESFSSELLDWVLARTSLTDEVGLRMVDPFAGVATSLVSALQTQSSSGSERFEYLAGVEQNPFLQLVSRTKVRAHIGPPPRLEAFRDAVQDLYAAKATRPSPRPGLSTFANPDYFPPNTLRSLLRLKSAIEAADGDELSKDIARVCLAACLEPLSNLRRDGRALRFDKRNSRPNADEEFVRRVEIAIADIETVTGNKNATVSLRLGDGRNVTRYVDSDSSIDLALFSPPYPNNIDYTEVYKLENWFLDLIGSSEEFRAQRLRTVRSHPSVVFPELYELSNNGHRAEVTRLLGPLLAAIPSDRYRHQRRRMIAGYFEDMLATLKGLHQSLSSGGRVVYVVGNPAHGHGANSFVVASDIIMASLAQLVGFVVDEVVVARFPSRRNLSSNNAPSAFIRESLVILRK